MDVNGLRRDESATELALNDIGRIRLHTTEPMAIDDYQLNRATGSFILIDPADEHHGGRGTVKFAAQHAPSPNVVRHTGKLTAEERYRHLGVRGATVLFTGLSGSGKSTLAAAVEELLVKRGQPAFMVDGDNLRHNLCSDLGFSPEDRAENLRRAGAVAQILAEDGTVALMSLISPSAEERRKLREVHVDRGLTFFEVYVNTPLEVCERRDPKGLYARARAGELSDFTGVDAPYEVPLHPDLELTPAVWRTLRPGAAGGRPPERVKAARICPSPRLIDRISSAIGEIHLEWTRPIWRIRSGFLGSKLRLFVQTPVTLQPKCD